MLICVVSFIVMILCLATLSKKNEGDKRILYISEEDYRELAKSNLEEAKKEYFVM